MESFQQWSSKLKSSAASAAMAARAFQGLDALAAKDDYIHSDSLNVKRKTRVKEGNNGHEQPPPSQSGPARVESGKPANPNGNSHQLLSVVQNTLSSSSQHTQYSPSNGNGRTGSKINSHAITVGDSDDEEQDEDDPILSLMRQDKNELSKTHTDASPATTDAIDDHQPLLQNDQECSRTQGRNRQRFFDDLEDRTSKPNPQPPTTTVARPDVVQSVATSKPSWIFSPLNALQRSGNATAEKPSSIPPLRREEPKRKAKEQASVEASHFEIVTSKGMLGEDELAELEQLRANMSMQQSKPSMIQMASSLLREYPRESFIGLTLLLAAFAYFYSKSEVIPDDITR